MARAENIVINRGSSELCDILRNASASWNLAPDDIVIANGSRFEELGNDDSDLDAWVITSDEQCERSVPVFDWQQGLHLNMSSYRHVMVCDLAQKLNGIPPDASEIIAALPANTLDRYYRVCSAQAVVNGAAFDCLRGRFSLERLTNLLITWTGLHAVLELDKGHHALDTGRPEQALLCARRAAEAAIDHVAARHGEVYPSLKWRFEKLARCLGAHSTGYAGAWALKAPGTREPGEYLNAVADYARRSGALAYPVVPSRLQRAPSTELFELAGAWYLVQGKAVLFQVNEGGRWLWERLDGTRTELDLIAEYEALFPAQGHSRAGAARFLAQALDTGLATYSTDTLF